MFVNRQPSKFLFSLYWWLLMAAAAVFLVIIITRSVPNPKASRWLGTEDVAEPQIVPDVPFGDLETQIRESVKNTTAKIEALKKTIADQQAILKQGAGVGGNKVVQARQEIVKRLSEIMEELARLNESARALEQQLIKIRKTCELTNDDDLNVRRRLSVIQERAENVKDQLESLISYLRTTEIVLLGFYKTTPWDQMTKKNKDGKEDRLALLEALAEAEKSIEKLENFKKAKIIPPMKPAPPKKPTAPDESKAEPPIPITPPIKPEPPTTPSSPIFGTPKSPEEARKKLRDNLERWAEGDRRFAQLLEREINEAIKERTKQLWETGKSVEDYQKIFERIKRLEYAMRLTTYLKERSTNWREMARRTPNITEIDLIIEAVRTGRDKYDELLKQISGDPPESAYIRARILLISAQQSRMIAVLEQLKKDWQALLPSSTLIPRQ